MTMTSLILAENQKLRLTVRLPLLFCFALFTTWQMGVIYFSGPALSLDGRTPLPVSVGNMTALIAGGYILSAVFTVFYSRYSVIAGRITTGGALVSVALLYVPFPPEVLAALIYFQSFCCVFMIGLEQGIGVNLFTGESAIYYAVITAIVVGAGVALLQNDIYPVPYPAFRLISLIALSLLLFFFCRLPPDIWPRYVKKADGLVRPRGLFIAVYALFVVDCFLTLFGTAAAEPSVHGVSVLYLASGIFGGIVFLFWKRFGISPLRSAAVLVALGALGFVFAIVALYVPVFSLVSCALMGAGTTACWLNPFIGNVLAKRYPSRFITPGILLVALGTVGIHSFLLEAFRTSLQILYIAYLGIAVCAAILYLVLEPLLTYSFREQAVSGMAGTVPGNPGPGREGDTGDPVKPVVSKAAGLAAHAFDNLSGQEIRLAELIMQGYGNAEMAEILHITGNTVKGYRKTLYSKLQIHSRRELFELAEKAPTFPV